MLRKLCIASPNISPHESNSGDAMDHRSSQERRSSDIRGTPLIGSVAIHAWIESDNR